MFCLIAGDSIAYDVGQLMHQCTVNAKIGISSDAIIHRVGPADYVIISSGSNDPDSPHLLSNLEETRSRVGDAKVIWIVPQHRRAAQIVNLVAARHGDAIVTFSPAKDGVHPHSNVLLAKHITEIINDHHS